MIEVGLFRPLGYCGKIHYVLVPAFVICNIQTEIIELCLFNLDITTVHPCDICEQFGSCSNEPGCVLSAGHGT